MNDISLRGIVIGLLIVLSGIAASLLFAWAVASWTDSPPQGANGARPPQIQGAMLQTAPHDALEEFLREKRARLENTGPDHIPIEEAMRTLAERGRP
jgi:hypothetical protein